jgi:hypothetical protein
LKVVGDVAVATRDLLRELFGQTCRLQSDSVCVQFLMRKWADEVKRGARGFAPLLLMRVLVLVGARVRVRVLGVRGSIVVGVNRGPRVVVRCSWLVERRSPLRWRGAPHGDAL